MRSASVPDPFKATAAATGKTLYVTPSEMFVVRVANPEGVYVSQLCRYIVASGDNGEAVMGLSIAHDPQNPAPLAPYETRFEDLEFTVVRACDLVSVTPYGPGQVRAKS